MTSVSKCFQGVLFPLGQQLQRQYEFLLLLPFHQSVKDRYD
jgi:hypothetical protein